MRKVLVEKTVLAPAAVVGVEDKQTQLGARHGEWLRRQRPGSRSSETLKRNTGEWKQLLDSWLVKVKGKMLSMPLLLLLGQVEAGRQVHLLFLP